MLESPPLERSTIHAHSVTAIHLVKARMQRERVIFAVILALTAALAIATAAIENLVGFKIVALAFVALCLGALVLWRPIIGYYTAVACVVVIEELPLKVHDLTDLLYIYSWPPKIQSLPERPIGFLFIYIVLVLVFRRLAKREAPLSMGPLGTPLLLFMGSVLIGVAHGLASGGTLKNVVIEVRPFWYLFFTYLLAYNIITDKRHVRTFLWIGIIGAAIKGLQGIFIVVTAYGGKLGGQNQIMAHEESFFWVAILLLIVLFCLHTRDRAQFWVAIAILPLIIPSLIANNRRADYVALVIGIVVTWALVIIVRPERRKALIAAFVLCMAIGGAYVLAFSNQSGSIAQPARAIVSTIHPSATDARDVASNAYRITENYDLKYTWKQSPIIGYGFGKQFLEPVLLPNISAQDPVYLLVPHNTIYWVLMRLGIIGYGLFWVVIGTMIVRGCLIVRNLQDRYLQLVGIFAVGVILMEIVVATADYQLFFYRNVIYFGLLAGLLMKLPALDAAKERAAK